MSAVDDDDLRSLAGATLTSSRHAGVEYVLERVLGQGSHGVAFLAVQGPAPVRTPVVIKLLRPRAIRDLAGQAAATVEKEVRALERLSERFPPTPYVVRFLDAGAVRVRDGAIELPWLAIEYVGGGAEGTTLRARVDTAIGRTGYAFGRKRAQGAARAMIGGIASIHEVGVVHRDVSPGNVLCSGSGESELLRIADLGLARVRDAATFGKVLLGTPGYCAPEQSFPGKVDVGPYSDVFGVACCVYFALTGDDYFGSLTIPETLVAAHADERPRLAEARNLCLELAVDPGACSEIDRILARATRGDPHERIQTAAELGALLLPVLEAAPGASRTPVAPARSRMPSAAGRSGEREAPLRFGLRRPSEPGVALGSVAWDDDGHFLATTVEGSLRYWDGWALRKVPRQPPSTPRAVHRVGLRRWLVAGERGAVAELVSGSFERALVLDPEVTVVALSGSLDDVVVLVAQRSAGALELWVSIHGKLANRGELRGHAEVAAIVLLDGGRWLIAGSDARGNGVVSEFDPVSNAVAPPGVTGGSRVLACASRPDLGLALCVREGGALSRFERGVWSDDQLPAGTSATAAAIDPRGGEWVGALGALWSRAETWTCAWRDPSITSPCIAVSADLDCVTAVTVDAGVVRGERWDGGEEDRPCGRAEVTEVSGD